MPGVPDEAARIAAALAASLRRQGELAATAVPAADTAVIEAFREARHAVLQERMAATDPAEATQVSKQQDRGSRGRESSTGPDAPPPWSRRAHKPPGSESRPVRREHLTSRTESVPAHAESLEDIREDLGPCTRCKLCERRQNIVFGVGAPQADLLFIGEGPGADEDAAGEPFVGRAGQLLDRMISAMGLARGDVYIANIVKCRPPENRDPEPDEVATCLPFLERQIRAVSPRVIVTLGRIASQSLLETDARMGALRGRWHDHGGIPVMPTWHPAYLLRNAAEKRSTWTDLQAVMERLGSSGVN